VAVGLRYGRGELVYKRGGGRKVDWQGPSLGFDISANAVNAEYRRAIPTLPGVEGSLFFVRRLRRQLPANAMVFHSRRCASVSAGGKVSA